MWKVGVAFISCYDNENRPTCTTLENPTWDQVNALIELIGCDRLVTLRIDGPKEYTMMVEGCRDQYYVTTIGKDMGPYDLLGPNPSEKTINILLGGVLTDFPRRFLARREQAIQAAEYFFHNGKIDPTLSWHLC